MKRYGLFAALAIFFAGRCWAQVADSTTFQAGWGTLNYSVPESPAFKILGVSPDNILRPASTRDIAIAIGNYYLNNGASIPKNVSVELAPSLFNPSVSLSEYQHYWTRLWYTSSYSVATEENQDGSYALSFGMKLELINNADLRSNPILNRFISEQGSYYADAFEEAMNEEAEELARQRDQSKYMVLAEVARAYSDTSPKDPSENPEYQKIHSEVNQKIGEKVDVEKISKFRDKIKNSLWNATVWDFGIAVLFASSDSLIKHLSAPSRVGLWTTLGFPLGTVSQILMGINVQGMDDSKGNLNQWNCSSGARVYYGRNDLKGFIQGETDLRQSELPIYRAGIGIETTFSGSIWFDFSIGIQKTGSGNASFAPAINISYASGERK